MSKKSKKFLTPQRNSIPQKTLNLQRNSQPLRGILDPPKELSTPQRNSTHQWNSQFPLIEYSTPQKKLSTPQKNSNLKEFFQPTPTSNLNESWSSRNKTPKNISLILRWRRHQKQEEKSYQIDFSLPFSLKTLNKK